MSTFLTAFFKYLSYGLMTAIVAFCVYAVVQNLNSLDTYEQNLFLITCYAFLFTSWMHHYFKVIRPSNRFKEIR